MAFAEDVRKKLCKVPEVVSSFVTFRSASFLGSGITYSMTLQSSRRTAFDVVSAASQANLAPHIMIIQTSRSVAIGLWLN